MGWRSTAERVSWRWWQLCTVTAVGATLVHAFVRYDLLVGVAGPARCVVVVNADDVLPADCWLSAGWLGVRGTPPAWNDPGWRVLGVIAGALSLALIAAGSSQRRQASLLRVGAAWLVGGWAAAWAFEIGVRDATGAGPGWALRTMGWAPLGFCVAAVFGFWSYSPWRTLEPLGLRGRRRRSRRPRASRSPAVTSPIPALPDVHVLPRPVRVAWPVPIAAALVSGARGR